MNYFYILFTKKQTFDDVCFFVIWEALPPFAPFLRAHNSIMAQIPSTEAKVFANWAALRKSVVLLAPLIIFKR